MLSVASDLVGLRLPTSLCLEYGLFALFVMIELMIQIFIEVRITYSSPHNQLPAVRLYLMVYLSVCCSVLQCVAVCCSVLQCVVVCCSACGSISWYISHLLRPSKDNFRLCLPLPTNSLLG